MKLTLIKPTIGRMTHSLYVDEARMEPLNLGVLAALTPEDVDVVMYDDRMEPIPYQEPTDLVAITVETYTARRSYEIADEYRRRGVRVIMGGFQPTFVPDECAAHADSIFIGDAETAWATVIEDARRGELKPRYHALPGRPQTGVLTRRDIYRGKGYLPISLLQFSRGCRFVCDFCAVTKYFDKKHYLRAIDETLAEVADADHRLLFFVDDNIASNRSALKELCRALIPMRVNWVSQASLDITSDREAMKLMVDAGCLGHIMGFEFDHAREHQGSQEIAEHAEVRPVCDANPHPARIRAADLGGIHAGLRSRHARTRCVRRSTSRWTTASPSRPSTSSCRIRTRHYTSGSPAKAATSMTANGGCIRNTASTMRPLCRLG